MRTLQPFSLKNDIRELCIRNGYFTRGDNMQYERMFDMAADPEFTVRDTAMMIYTCSDEEADFYEIQSQIEEIAIRWQKA